MTSPSLEDLRGLLKQRDEAIVSLLNRRSRISIQIGHLKRKAKSNVYDPVRENSVYDYLSQMNRGPLPETLLKNIYSEILFSSRVMQSFERTTTVFKMAHSFDGTGQPKERKNPSAAGFPETGGVSYNNKNNGMICVSIVALSNEEALEKLDCCLSLADIVELRIDFIRDVDLKTLLSRNSGRIMIANRTKGQGGRFAGEGKDRFGLFEEAVALGAGFIDIESNTDEAAREFLLKKIHIHNDLSQMIVSYHDFTGTPSYKALKDIFHECLDKGGNIIKIVTFANRMEDNLNILRILLYAGKMKRKIIAHCMGKIGRPSRVMAPFFGSFVTFASLEEGNESAPGQFRVEEMSELLRILEYGT